MAQSVFDVAEQEQPQTFEDVAQDPAIVPGATVPAPGGFQGTRGSVEIPPRIDVQPAEEGAGFSAAFKSSFVTDPGAQLRILATERFPDLPPEQAMARFGFVDGNPVFVNDAGELEAATGGFADAMGKILAESPEITGAVAGAFLPAPVLGSAVGASTGEATKRLLANVFLDDPQTISGNVLAIGGEGALDLTFGGLAKFGTKLINKNAIAAGSKRLNTADLLAERQAIKDATGIELDLAQVSDLAELRQLKKWASQFPGKAAEVIQANDELIAGQSRAAIDRYINMMAGGNPTLKTGVRTINAANAAVTAAKAERAATVGPLYKKAFQEGAVVDPSKTLALIDDELQAAKGPIKNILVQTRKLFQRGDTFDDAIKVAERKIRERKRVLSPNEALNDPVIKELQADIDRLTLDDSLLGLHNAKRAIDHAIETKKSGSTVLTDEMVFKLQKVRDSLDDDLVDASDLYRQANEAWAGHTQAHITPLMESPIGILSKMEAKNAGQAAAKIFAGESVDPGTVRVARDAMQKAEAANPELAGAWDGAVAQWMQKQLVRASKETQTGRTINFAGKFRQALIGTDVQKEALAEAVGPNGVSQFNQLMNALQRVASTPLIGSDTAFNQLVTQKLGRSRFSLLQSVLTPRQTVLEGVEQRFMDDLAEGVATALTDPAKARELNRLFAMRPSAERALLITSVVLGPAAATAAASELIPAPNSPPPQLRGLNRTAQGSIFDVQ